MISSAKGLLIGIAAAASVSGCASVAASSHPPPSAIITTRPAQAAGRLPVDRLTAVAKRHYREEVHGRAVHIQLRRIAADHGILQALRSGNLPQLRAAVRREQASPAQHVSRLRIVRGSRVLADAGVPFVVPAAQQVLRDATGRPLGTLQVSIQDVIGFVRLMHRNYPVDVVVRGRGAAHVRTSLPAALRVRLPQTGSTTIAGRRYTVRSFHETAFGDEPLTVWILTHA